VISNERSAKERAHRRSQSRRGILHNGCEGGEFMKFIAIVALVAALWVLTTLPAFANIAWDRPASPYGF